MLSVRHEKVENEMGDVRIDEVPDVLNFVRQVHPTYNPANITQ